MADRPFSPAPRDAQCFVRRRTAAPRPRSPTASKPTVLGSGTVLTVGTCRLSKPKAPVPSGPGVTLMVNRSNVFEVKSKPHQHASVDDETR